jgi:hypothetical protein
MRRKNPPDDILVDGYTEGQGDLFGNARTFPTWDCSASSQ